MKPLFSSTIFVFLFVVNTFFGISQPSNDACSSATSLPCGTTNLAGTTVGSVSETSPGLCVGSYGVWYTFVGNGFSTTISVTSPMDIGVAFKSGSCGSLSNVTCVDGPGAGGTETYTFTPTNGTTYFIYIAYWSSGTTTGTFTISRTCVTPPSNDLCSNATSLPCGTTNLAGTTVGTVSETPGVGCTMSGYGVWYSFIGDGQITTISSTSTSGTFDHEMAIVSGSCGAFSNVTCQDIPAALGTETYTFATTLGLTYFVYIADYQNINNTGTFRISRSCAAAATPPVNDACANATVLACETINLAGTTVNSVSEIAPSACTSYITNYGVWYSFVGDGSTTSITVQETGGFDTGVGIYSGTCGALTNLYCLDAVGASNPESQSFTTTSGLTYFVYVSYFDTGSSLTGTFTISRTCPLPTSQDCIGAVQICDDQALSGNSSGYGVQELNSSNFGCFAGGISEIEDQSSWYFFQANATGTLEFILTSQPSVDYDFIVWGPNKSCSSLGSPIRCDASAVYEETGMVTINPDNGSVVTNTSSNPGATSTWIQSLNVTMGQTYIMMINNFTANATPFALDWTFSVPGLLNCTPISLPIEFGDFYGINKFNENQLYWKSMTEHNNDYYTLERSRDGHFWETIQITKGAINSTSPLYYSFNDYEFNKGLTNYYRLSQTDLDGLKRELKIISIDNRSEGKAILRRVNLLGQIVDEAYRGLVIIEFEDGSTQKVVQ